MTNLRWAPFIAAFIITDKVWNSIPEELRPELEETAHRIAEKMSEESHAADKEAIEVMRRFGLAVHDVPRDAEPLWQELIDTGVEHFIGGKFETRFYDQAKQYLEEFRSRGAR
jgi:TRAP-type C4-dicarboxylate transport system substrate-binding protein